MRKEILSLTVVFLLLANGSLAAIGELETVIIQQDYAASKKLALALLDKQGLSPQERHEVQFYLALSHLQLGEYKEAKNIFEDLISQPLDEQLRDRSYLGLFNTHYLNEDYKEAYKAINKLYEISPRSSFMSLIYLKLGRVNLKLANWRKASEYFKKIISDFPDSMEVHTAKQLLEERQYFAVQVGAFLDRGLAEKQIEELRQKNEYAYIVETLDKENRKFYRVRVGQMTLLDDARQLKSKLAKEGYPTEIYP
ncbi:MAG TPA: tetratricopeptide repeat protein [Candidatus Omnitrophota bacterium]|nr:tetratricopeptide repeat protein [Candidatus Omnitrophota bacterium]